MKKCPVIGITGGVGAGKSVAMEYLKGKINCTEIIADNLANELKLKGNCCYEPLVELLGNDVLNDDEEIDKAKMAAKIFADSSLLEKINAIIHPAVRTEIERIIAESKADDNIKCVFLEAALLIECNYEPILDGLWYICSSEETRVKRLEDNRGYSRERSRGIISSQLSEDEYKAHATHIIYNNGNIDEYYANIDEALTTF